MSERLWVSDNGDVVCENHAGTYLKSAIKANPNEFEHSTPLDNWSAYYAHLSSGGHLVCEVCVPWDSPDHPYNKLKAVA
jgi:hypothetical protein